MPVQIGAKAHHFNDPTGLLSDCHRRIEMFLGSLEAVATVIDHPPTEDVRRALESALRYFSQAAPKHTADEEQSLFPRLRDSANPEVASALSRLDELEAEHRWADPLHAEVERIGVKYLSEGSLSSRDVPGRERYRKRTDPSDRPTPWPSLALGTCKPRFPQRLPGWCKS
jgi:hypothetical protein